MRTQSDAALRATVTKPVLFLPRDAQIKRPTQTLKPFFALQRL